MKRVVVLEAADEELVEAAKFYESRSSGLGIDFLAELDHVIARITDHPHAGAVVSAVMHLRRRPGYWRAR